MLRRERASQKTRVTVERGLIIQQPWVGMIADGRKSWEMRTRQTRVRGWIGLLEQGAGQIIGVAYLKASPPALQRNAHHLHYRKHRVKREPNRKLYRGKYLFPWVLQNAIRLQKPMKYKHPSGAVTWVKLSNKVSRTLARYIRKAYSKELR